MLRRRQGGFTLIEVLVAMAVVAIALTAIVRASQTSTRDLGYLYNKTVAHWVGLNVVSKVRVGLIQSDSEGQEQMLSQSWPWEVTIQSLNKQMIQAEVSVYDPEQQQRLEHFTWKQTRDQK